VIFGFGSFEFDDELLELRHAGREVKLDALVKRLLATLLRRAGELVTKDELFEEVWEGRAVAENSLTVAMARLRRALDAGAQQGEFVITLYGRGYRFVGPVVRMPAGPRELRVASSTGLPLLSSQLLAGASSGSLFVGRERALDRLAAALAQAQAGKGRICAVVGEPGIGKTRVVEALQERISKAPVRVAWGFCREAGDTPPLWPWLRLLREVAASSSTESSASGTALRDLLLRLEDTKREETDHLDFTGAARHQTFEAIGQAFALAANDVPWVLVLDDLHRADGASLELLGQLVDEIAHTRLLLVVTLRHTPGRPAPRPDTHLPYVLAHRNCERIALERLREEDVLSYVAASIDNPDERLGKAVFARSEGNPFFMTELSRQLRDAVTPTPESLAISDIALDSIRQRVAKLGTEAREVLVAAAVIGRSFELPVLQAVTGRGWAALMASIDDAIAIDLLVAASESSTAFAFGHDLMRGVLYDGLTPAERRQWHIKTAEVLERRIELGHPTPPSELAFHLHSGLPESDLRKTVHYCRAASAAAATVFANNDLIRYLFHALEALDLLEKPSARLRLSLWYTITVYGRGQTSLDYAHAVSEVIRLAKEQGDAVVIMRAALMYNPYPGFQPIPGARAALEHALSLLPDENPSARSLVLSGLSCTAPHCYDAERSRALLTESVPLARRSGSRAAVYVSLVATMFEQGGPDGAEIAAQAARELEQMYQRDPCPRLFFVPLYVGLHRAAESLQRGDLAAMSSAIARGLAHAREIGNTLQWHFERAAVLTQINAGKWVDAMPKLVALHRRAQPGLFGSEPFCSFDRAVVFGEAVDNVPNMDDSLRSALDFNAADPPGIWAMKVRALASIALYDEARGALGAVTPDDLSRLPCDSQYLGTLGHLARAAAQLGELSYAAALYRLLARYPDYYAGHYAYYCEGSVPHLLGILANALGRRDAAIAHLELGLSMNEKAGLAPRAAEARTLLAKSLLQSESPLDRERAIKLCEEALNASKKLGMRMLSREAGALLRAHTGSPASTRARH